MATMATMATMIKITDNAPRHDKELAQWLGEQIAEEEGSVTVPERVLHEAEAKRRMIAQINNHAALMGWDELHGNLLRSLASVYADRPGYRANWRP